MAPPQHTARPLSNAGGEGVLKGQNMAHTLREQIRSSPASTTARGGGSDWCSRCRGPDNLQPVQGAHWSRGLFPEGPAAWTGHTPDQGNVPG